MKISSSSAIFAAVIALHADHSFGAGFEWAGTFPMSDASHTWSMQSVGGAYADPSMRIVIKPTESLSQEAIEMNESSAGNLITSDACQVVEAGQTIGPFDASTGSCYELKVGTGPDSLYPMNTQGLSGIVVFAQHFPTEFERDMHYLKDSTGADIEPVSQEGGDGHDHDHGHVSGSMGGSTGEPCACAADEYGFNVDCSATTAMVDSFNFMKSAGCASDCTTDTCQKAWYIVQIHHDYCDVDSVPAEIEDGFHDFDETCKSCVISRKAKEGVLDCPTANCENQSGNEAYAFLVDNGCANDCSTNECKNAYLTLRTVHDDCAHDALSTASEEGLHDFEDICKVSCNTPASQMNQLSCVAMGGTTSSAATIATGAGAALFGAALLLA